MEKSTGAPRGPRTAPAETQRVKDCAPLPSVYHYRRHPERAGRVLGHLQAAASFTAADHLERVLRGKKLQTAEALLLKNAVAALHRTTGSLAAPSQAGATAQQSVKKAQAAYDRCTALLAELCARRAGMAEGLRAAQNLENSLGWQWSPHALPPGSGRDGAVQEGLCGLLEHLETSGKTLERSTAALGRALRLDPPAPDLGEKTTTACGDLVRLRSALETYQEGLAEACVALWKRAVKVARKEFTEAVDHYDREFALMAQTFKATALVLGAAGTAASAVCPPVAALAIGVAVAGVAGPAAALKKRAEQETADPERVVELLRNKAVEVSRLNKAKTAHADKDAARTAAGRTGDLADNANEGFGAVSNLLTAAGASHPEVAAAAAVLAETTVIMATTPAGAAIGHIGLFRDAAASKVRKTMPVGGAEREQLPGDARRVRKTAARPAAGTWARTAGRDKAGRTVTAANGREYVFDPDTGLTVPVAEPAGLPTGCVVTSDYHLWHQLTEQSFAARAEFVLGRIGRPARPDGTHPAVIETVTVTFTDFTGRRRIADLTRLGRDATGEQCLVKAAPNAGLQMLHPDQYVPPAIDAVQAYALDRPDEQERRRLLLDTATPYYQAGIVFLHQEPRWQVQQVSENLPWVEIQPFQEWLLEATGEADRRNALFERHDRAYDDLRH